MTERQDGGHRAAAAVPVATVVANLAAYALLLAAAHLMSPARYGALSSLLGLLLVATVPMLALQTVAARRAASGEGLDGVVRGTVVVGLATATGLVAVSPALSRFLHLPSVTGVLFVAVAVPATAVLGTAMGVAQGRRQYRRLAVLVLVTTGSRSLGGLAGLLVRHAPVPTLAGIAAGVTLAAGAVAVTGADAERLTTFELRARTGVLAEAAHAAHAHGSFLLLTSLDVLLARHVLSPTGAGVYAVGSVISRAALWLPQSVALIMFASLADSAHHRASARRAVLGVAAVGVLAVLATALLGPLVVAVVGGSRYHVLDSHAWLFALLGSLLALVQLAVLAGLAQRRVGRAALLWCTVVADLGAVLLTSHDMTSTRLVATLTAVASASAAVAVALTVRRSVDVVPDTLPV